jgi:hypothetical protein
MTDITLDYDTVLGITVSLLKHDRISIKNMLENGYGGYAQAKVSEEDRLICEKTIESITYLLENWYGENT